MTPKEPSPGSVTACKYCGKSPCDMSDQNSPENQILNKVFATPPGQLDGETDRTDAVCQSIKERIEKDELSDKDAAKELIIHARTLERETRAQAGRIEELEEYLRLTREDLKEAQDDLHNYKMEDGAERDRMRGALEFVWEYHQRGQDLTEPTGNVGISASPIERVEAALLPAAQDGKD